MKEMILCRIAFLVFLILPAAAGCGDDGSVHRRSDTGVVDGSSNPFDGSSSFQDGSASDSNGFEICDNNTDDDSDGLTDCDDPDCIGPDDIEPQPFTGITAEHNKIRCAVAAPGARIPNLVWSESVSGVAQAWADQLASESCQDIRHSGGQYGENLFWGTGGYGPAEVVEAWADEISCFTYGTFPGCCSCTCGHYTQIVWRNTVHVGCGRSTCGNLEVWVCNYDPPGNYLSQIPY